MEDLDRHGVVRHALRRGLLRQPREPDEVFERWVRVARSIRRARRPGRVLRGKRAQERGRGVAAGGVEGEAQRLADVGADDVDGARGVVAVDEEVWAEDGMVGQTQAVAQFVHDGDDFESSQPRELHGEVGRRRGPAPDGDPVARDSALPVPDAGEALCADVGGEGVRRDGADEGEQVGAVEDGGEVDAHADAEGQDGGDEGDAEGGAGGGGDDGGRGQADGVEVCCGDVLLVGGLAEVAVVCGDDEDAVAGLEAGGRGGVAVDHAADELAAGDVGEGGDCEVEVSVGGVWSAFCR